MGFPNGKSGPKPTRVPKMPPGLFNPYSPSVSPIYVYLIEKELRICCKLNMLI